MLSDVKRNLKGKPGEKKKKMQKKSEHFVLLHRLILFLNCQQND